MDFPRRGVHPPNGSYEVAVDLSLVDFSYDAIGC